MTEHLSKVLDKISAQIAATEIGLPNVVTSVLASYRGYDTLGETYVIFTAAAGVLAILGRGPVSSPGKDEENQDKASTSKLSNTSGNQAT